MRLLKSHIPVSYQYNVATTPPPCESATRTSHNMHGGGVLWHLTSSGDPKAFFWRKDSLAAAQLVSFLGTHGHTSTLDSLCHCSATCSSPPSHPLSGTSNTHPLTAHSPGPQIGSEPATRPEREGHKKNFKLSGLDFTSFFIIYTAFIHHSYIIYIHHLYIVYTTFTCHLYVIYTSILNHPHIFHTFYACTRGHAIFSLMSIFSTFHTSSCELH